MKLLTINEIEEKELNEFLKEMKDENTPMMLINAMKEKNIIETIKKSEMGNEIYVSSTLYFLKTDKIVGAFHLRHKLNERLLKDGGHIGYSIIKSERNKGYAKIGLELCLQKAKEMKINNILVCCLKENIASKKTIEANNGILENEINGFLRYWIKND